MNPHNLYLANAKSNTSTLKQATVPITDRPMTITEKNILGNKIRMLNQEQMKGIINILSDQCSVDNDSKFFEFDINTLATKKLRDLEKYVKKCLKGSSTTSLPGSSQPAVKSQIQPKEKIDSLKQNLSNDNKTTQASMQYSKPNPIPQPISKPIQMESPSSSEEEDDSGSLSSLDFKKGK